MSMFDAAMNRTRAEAADLFTLTHTPPPEQVMRAAARNLLVVALNPHIDSVLRDTACEQLWRFRDCGHENVDAYFAAKSAEEQKAYAEQMAQQEKLRQEQKDHVEQTDASQFKKGTHESSISKTR